MVEPPDAGGIVASCPTRHAGDMVQPWGWRLVETGLILLVFAVFCGEAPPGVGESHYLAKARHFWDRTWCAGDLFLDSASAHTVFYWSCGWLTQWFSLPTTAWIARLAAWLALAIGWQRLSFAVVPRTGWSVLTAGCGIVLIEYGHMAGEWVVGGVEAKCFAYALVFLALAAMLEGKWERAWLWLGGATAWHVLVGGWSWVAGAIAWLSCGSQRPPLRTQIPSIVIGLIVSLVGVAPALQMNAGVDAEIQLAGDWIHVFDRLPHHLVFHRLRHVLIARHVALIVAWGLLAWATPCRISPGHMGQRPLRGFIGGAIALAIIGAVIDQSLLEHLTWSARLLKFYWFRLSDSLVPLGMALTCAAACVRWESTRPFWSRLLLAVMLVVTIGGIGLGAIQHGIGSRRSVDPTFRLLAADGRFSAADLPERMRQWQDVCAWVRQNLPADARLITPRHQQTFKWFAARAEAVTTKDIPQDATSAVEWQARRSQLAYALPPKVTGAPPVLDYLADRARQWRCGWILVDTEIEPRLTPWVRVYPAVGEPPGLFEVYRVPDE